MQPFKNLINLELAEKMATHLGKADTAFKSDLFIKTATHNLHALELKQRSFQFTQALKSALPDDFEKAAFIIQHCLGAPIEGEPTKAHDLSSGLRGWAIMPLADYVGLYGREHFEISMDLFEHLTQRFSAEFAIRYFLVDAPIKTLKIMMGWTTHKSHHVRRLACEGCRPRLPWGMRLNDFIKDPQPLMPILDALKDDEEAYVRRSVANNLNDIAKDHADFITLVAKNWLKDADKNRQGLVKHACRSLIKQGHQPIFKILGFGAPNINVTHFDITPKHVKLGQHIDLTVTLESNQASPQPLIVDYAIHHQKANGRLIPKVFKWTIVDLRGSQTLSKKHRFKPVTTRTYYAGAHGVELLINGVSFGVLPFQLEL